MTDIAVGSLFEADNGAQGLEVLSSSKVDLVFLDINMPIMNGLEFMKKVAVDDRFRNTPVIVVSTEGSEERKAELDTLGIRAYLRKPVTPEELATTVKKVLAP
jgi:two-component system chemotaxis response regulator CheY